MNEYYSNGKLLLSGEYVVLDGATALAVPTRYGQSLKVKKLVKKLIHWESYDHQNQCWFQGNFRLSGKGITSTTAFSNPKDLAVNERLEQILRAAHELNPQVLEDTGYEITTNLEFPNEWGLGTSSTLINNLSQWFGVDAHKLLQVTFGGSGYDIACAQHDYPITFSLQKTEPTVLAARFDPPFKDQLFFVYLNRKQNSRDSINHYRSRPKDELDRHVQKITSLTHQMIQATTLLEFELLMKIHENIISRLINTPKVSKELFPDYPRAIKSLGGWGGDFIMASGAEAEKDYFRNKGYTTIVPYTEMIL